MKHLYTPNTDDQRHAVATLLAASVRPYTIIHRLGVSLHALKVIQREAGSVFSCRETALMFKLAWS